MAFDWSVVYTNANVPDANYPQGSAKNVSTPSATDGTPGEKTWVNDITGFHQRLILEAGISISGAADTVLASDNYDALITLFSMKYDTVADMLAANLQIGSFVSTKGYLAAGDFGGANYMVVAGATGTPDGGQYMDITYTGNTNQVQLIPSIRVNSKQYGAVGNGATDDTTKIQNLLNAFKTVEINSRSFVTPLTIASDRNILVSETLSITTGAIFTATTAFQIAISFIGDGLLLGDSSTSTIAILFDGCTNCYINNPLITGFIDSGIEFVNGTVNSGIANGAVTNCGSGILLKDITTIRNSIKDVRLSANTNYGLQIVGSGENLLEGLDCHTNSHAGIFMTTAGDTEGNTFVNCKCNDNTGVAADDGGLVLFSATLSNDRNRRHTFIGMICNGNASHGIYITSNVQSSLLMDDLTFFSPNCHSNGGSGINLEDTGAVKVYGASCFSNTINGLNAQDSEGLFVSGGSFVANTNDGIRIVGNKTTIKDIKSTTNGRYGISVSGVADPTFEDHYIYNCYIEGNTTLPVSFSGTSGDFVRVKDCNSPDFVSNTSGIFNGVDVANIPHGLIGPSGYSYTNVKVQLTISLGGAIISLNSVSSTIITIRAFQMVSGNPVVTSSDIHWTASLY